MIPSTLLYFVRRGEANDELRFSLRSAEANLPHERVLVVGGKPSWVTGVDFIRGNLKSTKWENGPDNLRLGCEALLAEGVRDAVIMNDDFYVMTPVTELPFRRRSGTLEGQVARLAPTPWRDSLARTLKLLRSMGIEDPLSYELHRPVVMDLSMLLEAVRVIQADRPRAIPAQWRTVYGNLNHVHAEEDRDRKTMRLRPDPEPLPAFDSSDDRTFRRVQRPALRHLFPEPSRYEGVPAPRTLGWRGGPARQKRGPQGTI